MTKKDFIAIAAAFNETHNDPELDHDTVHEALWRVAANLADYFASQNPRFDRQRFMNACEGL